jgi:hypothetical protein
MTKLGLAVSVVSSLASVVMDTRTIMRGGSLLATRQLKIDRD